MTSFTDAKGREWPLRITLGVLPRLYAVGVDVGFATDGVPQVVEAAFADPMQMGKTLWTLLEPLATERGVTQEEFAAGMDGPAIAAAVEAFTAAVVTFTHRPTVAPAVLEKLAATWTLIDATIVDALTSSASAGGSPATPAAPTPATSPTGN